jgi:hypothetical protein
MAARCTRVAPHHGIVTRGACTPLQQAAVDRIEPYAYLCYLFEEFPKAKTAEQLEALLPRKRRSRATRLPPKLTPSSQPNLNAPIAPDSNSSDHFPRTGRRG